jgi:hypothetical protein
MEGTMTIRTLPSERIIIAALVALMAWELAYCSTF